MLAAQLPPAMPPVAVLQRENPLLLPQSSGPCHCRHVPLSERRGTAGLVSLG